MFLFGFRLYVVPLVHLRFHMSVSCFSCLFLWFFYINNYSFMFTVPSVCYLYVNRWRSVRLFKCLFTVPFVSFMVPHVRLWYQMSVQGSIWMSKFHISVYISVRVVCKWFHVIAESFTLVLMTPQCSTCIWKFHVSVLWFHLYVNGSTYMKMVPLIFFKIPHLPSMVVCFVFICLFGIPLL